LEEPTVSNYLEYLGSRSLKKNASFFQQYITLQPRRL